MPDRRLQGSRAAVYPERALHLLVPEMPEVIGGSHLLFPTSRELAPRGRRQFGRQSRGYLANFAMIVARRGLFRK
jgi:hypothetical protein